MNRRDLFKFLGWLPFLGFLKKAEELSMKQFLEAKKQVDETPKVYIRFAFTDEGYLVFTESRGCYVDRHGVLHIGKSEGVI